MQDYLGKTEQLLSSSLPDTDYGSFVDTAFAQFDDAMVAKRRSTKLSETAAIVERATTFVVERLRAASELHGRTKQAYLEGPFFDPASPSLDALNTQIELARQWSFASKLKRETTESSVALFRRVLEGGPYPASIDPVVEAYERGLQMELLLEMNDADLTACQAIIDCHSMLKEQWGEWQYNTSTGDINFLNDPSGQLARQYDASITAIVVASMRVDVLLKEYLSRAADMFGSGDDAD